MIRRQWSVRIDPIGQIGPIVLTTDKEQRMCPV